MSLPPTPTSRPDALQARRDGLPAADADALSLRRFALQALLASVGAGLLGGAVAADGAATATALAVPGLVALAGLGVLHARARRAVAALGAWEELERTTRALPGEVPTDLRAPYDARDDVDFPQVASAALEAERTRPFGNRVLARSFLSGVGIAIGLTVVLAGAVRLDDDASTGRGLLTAGVVLLAVSLVAVAAATAYGWRSTLVWRRMGAEHALWSAQRELAGHTVERQPELSGASKVVALGALALVPLLVLVAVAARTGTAGLVTLAVLAAVGAALVLVPRLRRRPVGARLRAGGQDGCVVDGPQGPALLTATADGLSLGGTPLPPVLGATRGWRPRPFAAVEVALLHADDALTTVHTLERRQLDEVLEAARVPRLG